MGRFAAILVMVSGRVALQVVAQAVLLIGVRFIDRRMRSATELRRTFWISLGAVLPLFFGHLAHQEYHACPVAAKSAVRPVRPRPQWQRAPALGSDAGG